MGPTNVALVNLYQADQKLRQAQQRLDDAEHNVRVQERRVSDLAEKSRLAQTTLREQQSHSKTLELDLLSRDQHIEKLRTQQQVAKNNKEYQAFLIEISTGKADRVKVEEEAMKLLETVDKGQKELAALQEHLAGEQAKLVSMRAEIGDTVTKLKAEVDALRPQRDAASAALPHRVKDAFERLAEHHEGEALSGIAKPDRRREEYLCTACNMELAQDVYNKLHSRDEVVYCPSCRRIFYIPEDLLPEHALGGGKAGVKKTRTLKRGSKSATVDTAGGAPPVEIEQRAKGRLGEILNRAQAESVQSAVGGGAKPVECEVHFNGELAGIYKGKSSDHLQRAIRYFMDESRTPGELRVVLIGSPDAESSSSSGAPVDTAATEVEGSAVAAAESSGETH